MFGRDMCVAGCVGSADCKERWSGCLQRGRNRGTVQAVVRDLDLYRRCRQVGWDEDVQLGRAYKLDIGRFSVDGYTDAVELGRQLIVGEIGSCPGTGRCGECSSLNGDPGIRGERVRRKGGAINNTRGYREWRGLNTAEQA